MVSIWARLVPPRPTRAPLPDGSNARCPLQRRLSLSPRPPRSGMFKDFDYKLRPSSEGAVRTKVVFDSTGGGDREKGLNLKATSGKTGKVSTGASGVGTGLGTRML